MIFLREFLDWLMGLFKKDKDKDDDDNYPMWQIL
jgi:hypothetical protein